MQSAEVVLSMLGQKSIQNSDFVFDRLYRNLFNPDFYLLAASTISTQAGSALQGSFAAPEVERLIAHLKRETYLPQTFRRASSPARKGIDQFSAALPLQDRLVQEVVRILLQAIYEPLFKDSSHGFRPGRGCHTALVQVKTECKGTNWVIGGKIVGLSETTNRVRLLAILAKKIDDGRFLNLINMFLAAGYLELLPAHNSPTALSQGGCVGPILTNIYLHELDLFLEQIGRRTDSRSAARVPQQRATYVRYVRFAGDFRVMLVGDKKLAQETREAITTFLTQELQLTLDEAEMLIANLREQRVRFLGYEIARNGQRASVLPRVAEKKRVVEQAIQLLVPGEVVHERLKPFVKNGKSVHHRARVNIPLPELLAQYNAEMRDLYNYYCLAADVHLKLGRFRYYHYHSLLKTVARKERCSVAQVLSKYGVEIKVKQGTGTRRIFGLECQMQAGREIVTYFNASLRRQVFTTEARGEGGSDWKERAEV